MTSRPPGATAVSSMARTPDNVGSAAAVRQAWRRWTEVGLPCATTSPDSTVPLPSEVINGDLDAERVIAAYPFDMPRGWRPPTWLAFDEDGWNRQVPDPFEDLVGVVAVQARCQQQTLDLLRLDEIAHLAAVLLGVVIRTAELDADPERGSGNPRAGHDRWPIEVERGHDHADGEPEGGLSALGDGGAMGWQRGTTVDLRDETLFGKGGDVAPDGELADAELAGEVANPYRSLSA